MENATNSLAGENSTSPALSADPESVVRAEAIAALRATFNGDVLPREIEGDALAFMMRHHIEADNPMVKVFVDVLLAVANIEPRAAAGVQTGIEQGLRILPGVVISEILTAVTDLLRTLAELPEHVKVDVVNAVVPGIAEAVRSAAHDGAADAFRTELTDLRQAAQELRAAAAPSHTSPSPSHHGLVSMPQAILMSVMSVVIAIAVVVGYQQLGHCRTLASCIGQTHFGSSR